MRSWGIHWAEEEEQHLRFTTATGGLIQDDFFQHGARVLLAGFRGLRCLMAIGGVMVANVDRCAEGSAEYIASSGESTPWTIKETTSS